MNTRLLVLAIDRETDIILARQRTRRIAELVGFEAQDQTRITTAVSEIVRNALEYGRGGRVEYHVSDGQSPQSLQIIVQDSGPGIADVTAILEGRHRSETGMGVGILGARRLMDDFDIETGPGRGTRVVMTKQLPKRARPLRMKELPKLAAMLADDQQPDPVAEIRRQNQETLLQYQEIQKRQEELEQLNQELQDTNRGVVALYAELAERADHLRRADQLKSRFLSNMSHEFRTPLNSIMSLSRLLLARTDGELSAEQEKQVQFIRRSAESLTELVNDLLDLAKVEAGKTVVTPKEFTVGELFGALRGMLRPLLVGDNLALVFQDAEDLMPLITDEGKVSQILRNFISNAIKFTPRGEVRIWAEFDPNSNAVTFKVRDTGIGIAATDIDIIWQEFGQVENQLQSRIKGTGLGLPLSKKLAALLGGSVHAESAPGQGSVFSLTVPRVFKPNTDEPDISVHWAIEPGRVPVLVVEDNSADAFSVERILAPSGYQAIPARNIAEAKLALERLTPAAILLDVLLAGEECWRFLIEMKQKETTHDIPIVVISTTHEETKARSLGADEYLDKPVDATHLLKVLDSITGARSVSKVLLIDDEEVSRYLIRQLLPRGAFQLSEVTSAVAGFEHAQQERPDIFLVDLNMKDMDGFKFIERLAQSELRDIPAVVVTSMILDTQHQQRLSNASKVISKFDLTTEILVNAIREAVELQGRSP